ncbi:hypothetical protein P7K49_020246, partial [Saguinus oedipus]
MEGDSEELGARSTRGVLEARSGWCPWLASSPSVARVALCILICLLQSPPQEPRGPKSFICRLGNTASHTPAAGSFARQPRFFPSGFWALTRKPPLQG